MDRQIPSSRWRLVASVLIAIVPVWPARPEKPAPSSYAYAFFRRQVILALVLVMVCTLSMACWLGWLRSNPAGAPVVTYSALAPTSGSADFFTTILMTFMGDSYEVRYRSRDHHLKLGALVRFWGEPVGLRCAEATVISWEDRGIRALLTLPDSPVIGLDAPISLVSLSPDHTPEWVTWVKRVGRCRPVSIAE